MAQIPFSKYQGTGNDFVLVDQRRRQPIARDNQPLIERLCRRRFGVGADGLILLQEKAGYDFEMVYFNADGREGSLCGNGGRCTVAFAHHLGVIGSDCRFLAADGPHEAHRRPDGWIELQMADAPAAEQGAGYFFLDTGSPHYVAFVDKLDQTDVVGQGRLVRYSGRFREKGTNVNFVETRDDGIAVATYERGVEDETLSCGTGVTAAALAYYLREGAPGSNPARIPIWSKGGQLEVRFEAGPDGFSNIWLCGPAVKVFEGVLEV